jgi:uncharacterized membrane protein
MGRSFFAVGVIASGLQQLATGHFVRLVPKLPAWLPWPSFAAWLFGVLLVLLGVAFFVPRLARPACVSLAAMLLTLFFLLSLPQALTNPWAGFMWTNPLKVLALLSGAILLAGGVREEASAANLRYARALPWAAPLLGAFLAVCGIQHFVYADFVAQMVPAWLPERGLWAQLTGVCLMAAGVGVVIPRTVRLAATLTGIMIFSWVILLHVPRALASPSDPGETSGVFEALALSGVAFLLAGTPTLPSSEKP